MWAFFAMVSIIFMVAVIIIGSALMVVVAFNLYPNAAASIISIETATNSQALTVSGFFTVGAAVVLAISYYVRRIFISINKNNTPFTDEIVKSLTIMSLIVSLCVIAGATINILFPSVLSTLSDMITLSSILVPFAVYMALFLTILTNVFKYGTELQKESDETL